MKIKGLFYFLFVYCITHNGIAQINFEDQASVIGLNTSVGDLEYGCGVSFVDFNNDGWDDITLATEGGLQSEFFLNNQDGTYSRQNFTLSSNNVQGRQIVWADYDNDGDKDLFIASNADGNHLYNNDGSLNFTEVTASAGLPTNNIETWGASFGDINNDGFLDLFISNRDDNLIQPNLLYLNNQDGTFSDISLSAGIHTSSHLSFCSAFFDYNNDGWQDIYVINDKNFNENFLYHNNGNNTFTNVAAAAGVNIAIDAMTSTIGDYNNDGWFDIYITNTPLGGNVFYKNNGDGTFTDVTAITGTALNSFAWGSVLLDADNDMDIDMYVSCSMDGSIPSLASAQFYTNNGNETFGTPSSGFSGDTGISHANAIGDIDNDGYPEILVSNSNDENLFLWKNTAPQNNNWLKVKLQGVISNKDGIGSKIEISTNGNKQYRYTLCGEGYISQNSNTEFFGIGTNATIDYVKVTWLSGRVDYLENVSANTTLTIIEGSNPLSVNSQDSKISLLLYPNPVTDKMTLRSDSNISNVYIFNSIGTEVLKVSVKNNKAILNFSELDSGLYFVKVFLNDAFVIKKIVRR